MNEIAIQCLQSPNLPYAVRILIANKVPQQAHLVDKGDCGKIRLN